MLSSYSLEQMSISSPPTDVNVDIIGYDRIQVASNDNIYTIADTILNDALRSAEYGNAGEMITYGNPAGRGLLEERHEMKEKMKKLEDGLQITRTEVQTTKTELQTTKTELQDQITSLQSRVRDLTQSSEGYQKIRDRFLDVYRRDILENIDRQGRRKIVEGNKAAHEGDAITDASLYTSHRRFDERVLIDLYGLTANQISRLAQAGNFVAISTLNAHATRKANRLSIPPDMETAFNTFIRELESNHKGLTDGTTSLNEAYDAFWVAHRKYKE